jgi:proteasome lid subunit RPN8/RPN11
VTLTGRVATAVIEHARAEAPRECCGLLIGDDTIVTDVLGAANIADEPIRRYLIDPRDHLKAIRSARTRGLHVVGAYHSHPRSRAIPSATDAAEGFSHFLYVIVGLAVEPPELTAWTWRDGNFVAVPLVRVS